MWMASIEKDVKLLLGEQSIVSSEDVKALVEAVFDSEFYVRTNVDLTADTPPLEHYLVHGWREGRNPSATFDTTAYLNADPALKAIEACPLIHYVLCGAMEQRRLPGEFRPSWWHEAAACFDADYYRARDDNIGIEIDPLEHYFTIGWLEGRNPSPDFDTRYYLNANPDVQAAGICPLAHYVATGRAEGRLPRRQFDPVEQALAGAQPMASRVAQWPCPVIADAGDATRLRAALDTATGELGKGLVLAFGHDDYIEVAGGVQNCITDDHRAFNRAGFTFIYARPARPLPVLALDAGTAQPVIVRVNGELSGAVTVDLLAQTIAEFRRAGRPLYVVVHHLMGHAPEAVAAAVEHLAPDETIVWIHDFFTLCPNYALLRNNLAFCHGPDETSTGCRICVYGDDRPGHLARMRQMFGRLRPTVLTPSEVAAELWRTRAKLPHTKVVVRPHARLTMNEETADLRIDYPLRIGFLGFPMFHKGWDVFETLAGKHHGDRRYRFFHLGTIPGSRSRNIEFVPVTVRPSDRDAMVREVKIMDLDIVINWSRCYETFSFTAYEAVAGGAFVITRREAGNIWPAVSRPDIDRGTALDTEDELYAWFATGEVLRLDLHHRYGALVLRAATADYLLGSADGE
jgi:hypothetical protein